MLGLGASMISAAAIDALNVLLAAVKARAELYENQSGTQTIVDEFTTNNLLDSATILTTATGTSSAPANSAGTTFQGTLHSLKAGVSGTEYLGNTSPSSSNTGSVIIIDTDRVSFESNGLKLGDPTASPSNLSRANFSNTSGGNSLNFGKQYQVQIRLSAVTGTPDLNVQLRKTGDSEKIFVRNAQVGVTYTFHGRAGGTNNFGGVGVEVAAAGTSATVEFLSIKEVFSDFDSIRGTTARRVNEGGLIEDAKINQPRINFETSSSGVVADSGHILLEPQSTNHGRNTDNPDNWTNNSNNATLTTGKTDPMGGTQAVEVEITSISGTPYARHLFNGPSDMNSQFTVSYFVKYVSHQWIRLKQIFWSGGDSDTSTWFDIQNGVIGTNENDSATIEAYPNGWYRVSITFTIDAATDSSGYVHVEAMTGDGQTNYTNGAKWQICFAQGEDRILPTSYISTASSAVTRNIDQLEEAGSSSLLSSTSGVLYAEIKALGSEGTYRFINLGDRDNVVQNRVTMGIMNNEKAVMEIKVSDSSQVTQQVTTDFNSDFVKMAVLYKGGDNNCKFFVNGSSITLPAHTGVSIPSIDTLDLNMGGSTSFAFTGKVKCVAYFDSELNDTQLAALTS